MTFAKDCKNPVPLMAVQSDQVDEWRKALPSEQAAWAKTAAFKGAVGEVLLFSAPDGTLGAAAIGLGDTKTAERRRFNFAAARAALPEAIYRLQTELAPEARDEAALGWLLAGYRFGRYAEVPSPKATMCAPRGVDTKRLEIIAEGEALIRDLINTPTSDMGPQQLSDQMKKLAKKHDAKFDAIKGDDLLKKGFPMIHAVGRAAKQAPRLLEMTWGKKGPQLTLVGKGVCFDTGGLNIKPGASMGLMKKDMGGSANVLGLAHMIMASKLPLRLRVLVPAVENAIDGDAFRPGDILTSRKGLTVEINNTDAEGRLVLADALALADEESPDLIISMATLTGAARVAVGPDLAPFYATAASDAAAIREAAQVAKDPVWEMPFWAPYETMIEPGIADLDNAPKGGFAGSITAALFLRRFVTETGRYVHFDIYGWQPTAQPARPKGGVGQGARALLDALPALLKL